MPLEIGRGWYLEVTHDSHLLLCHTSGGEYLATVRHRAAIWEAYRVEGLEGVLSYYGRLNPEVDYHDAR